MRNKNEIYLCRVCGLEQLDPLGGMTVKVQLLIYAIVVVLSLDMRMQR